VAADRRLCEAVNAESTRNVMESALETGVSKVVHVSTTLVYGKPAVSPVTERVPPADVRFSQDAETKYKEAIESCRN
jgi:nucleoside-diphosphate-sugar epimerase